MVLVKRDRRKSETPWKRKGPKVETRGKKKTGETLTGKKGLERNQRHHQQTKTATEKKMKRKHGRTGKKKPKERISSVEKRETETEGNEKKKRKICLRDRGEKAKTKVGKRRTETGGLSTEKKKDRSPPPGTTAVFPFHRHSITAIPPPSVLPTPAESEREKRNRTEQRGKKKTETAGSTQRRRKDSRATAWNHRHFSSQPLPRPPSTTARPKIAKNRINTGEGQRKQKAAGRRRSSH